MGKNKLIIIIVAVVALLAVVGVVVFATQQKGSSEQTNTGSDEANVKTLKPEDIGLTLELSSDKKEAVMTMTKLDGIKSFEYEVSYDANEKDPESGEQTVLPQGVTSGDPVEVKSGESEITRSITLGTCSKNVCRYHDVVSDIKFLIKVNFTDGSVGQVEDTLKYPHEEVSEPVSE